MIPTFFLGVVVFVFILLTFQALRLTEFVLIHGVKLSVVLEMMAYLSTSFLPILFPMSLLFTVLLTYSRMSADSEVVACRAVGLATGHIMAPAVALSAIVAIMSAQTAFHIAPWGNRQFELLIAKHGALKPAAAIKEGTFSEGFFDLVVYANKVDSKAGRLQGVFIYDERKADEALTVVAREGRINQDPDRPGHNASLRLTDGSVHRIAKDGRHTKIDFSSYDINLSVPVGNQSSSKSGPSMTLEDLRDAMRDRGAAPEHRREIEIEYHRRWAISFACVIFALIGAGLGTSANRRAARGGGMAICLGLIVSYWVLYVTVEGLARGGQAPVALAIWAPNAVFSVAAFFALKHAWR
jgi:lipopolysaccharide export system permease protein